MLEYNKRNMTCLLTKDDWEFVFKREEKERVKREFHALPYAPRRYVMDSCCIICKIVYRKQAIISHMKIHRYGRVKERWWRGAS